MYALTRLAARTHQATTTAAAAALASDRDICSKHAEREDTLEHPVDLHALNLLMIIIKNRTVYRELIVMAKRHRWKTAKIKL